MKKTILTFFIIVVMVLGLTGCIKSKNEFDIGKKSDTKVSKKDVILTIKDGTLTNKGATLVLTNNSDKIFQYGTPYEIEIKKDKQWYKINVELYFTLPVYQLSANKSKEIDLNWEHEYGKLADGTYRILKEINYKYGEDKYETFNVAVEFTIE